MSLRNAPLSADYRKNNLKLKLIPRQQCWPALLRFAHPAQRVAASVSPFETGSCRLCGALTARDSGRTARCGDMLTEPPRPECPAGQTLGMSPSGRGGSRSDFRVYLRPRRNGLIPLSVNDGRGRPDLICKSENPGKAFEATLGTYTELYTYTHTNGVIYSGQTIFKRQT